MFFSLYSPPFSLPLSTLATSIRVFASYLSPPLLPASFKVSVYTSHFHENLRPINTCIFFVLQGNRDMPTFAFFVTSFLMAISVSVYHIFLSTQKYYIFFLYLSLYFIYFSYYLYFFLCLLYATVLYHRFTFENCNDFFMVIFHFYFFA